MVKGKYKAIIMVAAVLAALLIAGSVVRFASIHGGEGETIEAPAEDKGPEVLEEGPQNAEVKDLSFEEIKKTIIDGYSDDTRAFIERLENDRWATYEEKKTISFDEGTFSENYQNRTVTTGYAVLTLETEAQQEQGYNGETKLSTYYRSAMLTDRGVFLLTLVEVESEGSVERSITSSGFVNSRSYVSAEQKAEA